VKVSAFVHYSKLKGSVPFDLAGEGNQKVVAAFVAVDAGEAVSQNSTVEIAAKNNCNNEKIPKKNFYSTRSQIWLRPNNVIPI